MDTYIAKIKIWNQNFPLWRQIYFPQKVNDNPTWCRSKSNCLEWKIGNFYKSNTRPHTNALILKEPFSFCGKYKENNHLQSYHSEISVYTSLCFLQLCLCAHIYIFTKFTAYYMGSFTAIHFFHYKSWAFPHVIKCFLNTTFNDCLILHATDVL